MSMTWRSSAHCCRNAVRFSAQTPSATYLAQRRRWESTEAAAGTGAGSGAGVGAGAGAGAGASSTPTNPKISQIVDQISQLNLLETADLVSTLKTRLNIPDLPVGGFAAPGQAGAAGAPAEEEDEAPPVQEKTLFNLKLESFEDGSKPKVIKEIKSILGLSLVDSKKFVEGAPKVMKESVAKDEGEKIIETFKNLGAKAVME